MSPSYVLDVSATLAWCFEDEATRDSNSLLLGAEFSTILVPGLWHIELINVLLQAERRKRLTMVQISDFLDLVGGIEIQTDPEQIDIASRSLIDLARRHQLTAYDATYLDLAIKRGIPLATRDKALMRAAPAAGVELVPT